MIYKSDKQNRHKYFHFKHSRVFTEIVWQKCGSDNIILVVFTHK